MRNLIVIAMLLIAASAAGWFRVNRQGDRTLIEINRTEIREDARRAIDRGREFLDRNRDSQGMNQGFDSNAQQGSAWPQDQGQWQQQPQWPQDTNWQQNQAQSAQQDQWSQQNQWSQQQNQWPQQQGAPTQDPWAQQQGAGDNQAWQIPGYSAPQQPRR